MGVTSTAILAGVAINEEDARAVAREDLQLDGRIMISTVFVAWESARDAKKAQTKHDSDAKAQGLPLTIQRCQFNTLKSCFESAHHRLSAKECPAKAYVETRLEQIDEGELKPEALSDVVALDQEDKEDNVSGNLTIGKDGGWQLRKPRAHRVMPATTEEFRRKYKLMAVHWQIVALKFPNKAFARGLTLQTFADLCDWFLGDEVALLKGHDDTGNENVPASWKAVLTCEFETRKAALRRVSYDNTSLAVALEDARKSPEIRLPPLSHADGPQPRKAHAAATCRQSVETCAKG